MEFANVSFYLLVSDTLVNESVFAIHTTIVLIYVALVKPVHKMIARTISLLIPAHHTIYLALKNIYEFCNSILVQYV